MQDEEAKKNMKHQEKSDLIDYDPNWKFPDTYRQKEQEPIYTPDE